MNQLKTCQVAISLIPGVGNVLAKQLISYCGSPVNVFHANRKKVINIPGIGPKIADAVIRKNTLEDAEKIIRYCGNKGIRILHYTDEDYPGRLKQLYDAPTVLYFSGKGDLNPARAVGIVGTRRATGYGKSMVDEIVKALIKHKATIISGLAYGIDHHAHLSALKHKLPTLGVIAGGLSHIYPSLHLPTARTMLKEGGLLAEYPPDTVPEAHFFPERNRIIAGLCDVLIVAEAAHKGGALITAEYANNYNREVFAIPGNIHSKYSEGCNHLIKTHKAHIYTSLRDIEYIMNWDTDKTGTPVNEISWDDLSVPEKKIVQVFQANEKEILIDELSWKAQIPVNQVASHLLNLEFRGLVKALPGKKFKLLI